MISVTNVATNQLLVHFLVRTQEDDHISSFHCCEDSDLPVLPILESGRKCPYVNSLHSAPSLCS